MTGMLSDNLSSGSIIGLGAVTFPQQAHCNKVNTAGLCVTIRIWTHTINMHRK